LRKLLDKESKIEICLEIAKILFTLNMIQPPIHHGHLSSHNIFIELCNVEKCFKVKLSELEMFPLIKFANTFSGYRNVSVWSAPECLS
jgi:hypothetical protein